MQRLFALGLLVAVAAAQAPADLLEANPIAQTKYGPIKGYTHSSGVQVFRGVPFAAPPVGNLRFTSPRPPAPWNKTRDAIISPHACPQIRLTDFLFLGNEDCLYLDVYVPPRSFNDTAPKKVMFWIYGGGYSLGDKFEFGLYDGVHLAKTRDVILIAPNYRLGPLGFMALDELRGESPQKSTGNYALQDQQLALNWVRENVANFGGDPKHVTIFGESAGAFSVCWHLVSPGSKGLFRSAIMESGTCDSPLFFRSYGEAQSWSRTFAKMVGCDPASTPNLRECLRKLPTGKVMGKILGPRPDAPFVPKLYPVMPWGPAIDGTPVGLLDTPLNLISKGQWANVSLILGTNKDEGTIFVLAIPLVAGINLPLNPAKVNQSIDWFFGNPAIRDSVLAQYPAGDFKTSEGRVAALLRDSFFSCANRRIAAEARKSGAPVYLYHFTYQGHWIEDPILGNYHAAELEFVFGNPFPPILHIFDKRDHQISNTFGEYWSNLAKYNTPNGPTKGPNTLDWPVWNQNSKTNMVMDVPTQLQSNLFEKVCNFWDHMGPAVSFK